MIIREIQVASGILIAITLLTVAMTFHETRISQQGYILYSPLMESRFQRVVT